MYCIVLCVILSIYGMCVKFLYFYSFVHWKHVHNMLWPLHISYETWNISIYMCIWAMFKFITFLYKSVSFFPAALVVPLTHVFQWANWVSSSFALRFKRMQNRLSHFEPIPPQDTSPNRVQLHPAHSYSNFQAKLLR